MEITSEREMVKLGAKIGRSLKKGDVVALVGELGAGKTMFMHGIAEGAGVGKGTYISSPTFTILNIYKGRRFPIYHFDWYRMTMDEELFEFREYLGGDGVAVIEWADKFPSVLPATTKWVNIEHVDEGTRRVTIKE